MMKEILDYPGDINSYRSVAQLYMEKADTKKDGKIDKTEFQQFWEQL